jgi:hypothetical protein
MNESEMTEFLVAYDYGAGGLWGVMRARDEVEIRERYPELTIVKERPSWMTDDELERIRDVETHEVDGAPWGMLNAVLADRERGES